MYRLIIILTSFFTVCQSSFAQQFIGFSGKEYSAIQLVSSNPAYVNNASTGTEINIFGLSILAGTNAYSLKQNSLLYGDIEGFVENVDYFKELRLRRKYAWANVDVLGPAISFTYKKKHNIGIYTRVREIFRVGNIKNFEFGLIGNMSEKYNNRELKYERTGMSSHSFGEVGLSYGRYLNNDYEHIWKAGATVKYLMGISAISAYTNSTVYVQSTNDSIAQMKADLRILYSYNTNVVEAIDDKMDFTNLAVRNGRGSLGLDIGVQYQYHPGGNPHYETPYLFSFAASITDIGRITYFADTGSGSYTTDISNNIKAKYDLRKDEMFETYLNRMIKDTILIRTDAPRKFSMGLPAAFRASVDYNVSRRFNVAANILLNLRGNGRDMYRSGYVNYFNVTPSFGNRHIRVSTPFSLVGYQTVMLGLGINAGPFYICSNSLFSTLLSNSIRNADFYMGVMLKLKKKKYDYYTSEYR